MGFLKFVRVKCLLFYKKEIVKTKNNFAVNVRQTRGNQKQQKNDLPAIQNRLVLNVNNKSDIKGHSTVGETVSANSREQKMNLTFGC